MKRKLLKILTIIISIFSFLPILTFAQNNCLNFTGGVGEFEIIDKNQAKKVPLKNYLAKPAGWSLSITEGISFKPEIDRKNYFNNGFSRGSFKVKIDKPANINTSIAGSLTNVLYADYPYVSTETKDYYPKAGDRIEAKIKFKGDGNNQNLSLRILITASTTNNSNLILVDNRINNLLNNDWNEIIVTSSLPTNYGNLLSITSKLEFRFPISSATSKGTIWLDDYSFYAYRNNNCLTIPPRRSSVLKIIEVNHYFPCQTCERNKDFIKLYIDNDGWWGDEDYISLIIQYLNPNFKRMPYFLSTVMRRGNLVNNKYCRSTHNSVINQHFDRICSSNAIPNRLHPNADYPDMIEIGTLNRHTYWTWDNRDLRIVLKPKAAEIISKNFLDMYRNLYADSQLKPFMLAYDLLEVDGYLNPIIARQINQPIFLNAFKKGLLPYIEYIGNLGYGIYSNSSETNTGDNWYTQIKFTNGYLNEEFIRAGNYRYPLHLHKQIKSLIENKTYDAILTFGRYTNCNSFDKWVNFIVSLFYLTNQSNIYYALTPDSYSVPQCYPSLFYLPLGSPLEVNRVEEIVVASTTNFNNGALYKRNYTNGVVLVNISTNTIFQYRLSNNSEPINFSIYEDQFGNIYDVSQNATTINLPPLTGLILYSPSQNLQNLDLLQ